MGEITLPFQLKEGTTAYAAKVMANFNALIGKLNQLSVNGEIVGDLEDFLSLLSASIEQLVQAGRAGNANEIRVADGSSLQEKLDSGDLKGTSGEVSVQDRMCYFYVDEVTGHLHLVARDDVDADAYHINDQGHLIYTIPDPDNGLTATDYDLGQVRGPKGDSGDMSRTVYDTQNRQTDIFSYVDEAVSGIKTREYTCLLAAASWVTENSQTYCRIELSNLNASSKFDVGLSPSATEEQEAAFEKALLKVSEQGAGYFILLQRSNGVTPSVDIPLIVRIYP